MNNESGIGSPEVIAALIAVAGGFYVWWHEKQREYRTASFTAFAESIGKLKKDEFQIVCDSLGVSVDKEKIQYLQYFVSQGYMLKLWFKVEPPIHWFRRVVNWLGCFSERPVFKSGTAGYYFALAVANQGLIDQLEVFLGSTDVITAIESAAKRDRNATAPVGATGFQKLKRKSVSLAALVESAFRGALLGLLLWSLFHWLPLDFLEELPREWFRQQVANKPSMIGVVVITATLTFLLSVILQVRGRNRSFHQPT